MIYLIIRLFVQVLIVGLFLYSKLLPYKDRLNNEYLGVFNFFSAVFNPVLGFFKKFIPPFEVGKGLSVDMTQILLLLILLVISNI